MCALACVTLGVTADQHTRSPIGYCLRFLAQRVSLGVQEPERRLDVAPETAATQADEANDEPPEPAGPGLPDVRGLDLAATRAFCRFLART